MLKQFTLKSGQAVLAAFFLLVPLAAAEEISLPEIIVADRPEDELRLKKYEINRVEVLRPEEAEAKRAATFAQLIDNEKGVDTQTTCAFCGSKRITINGLRGEHTTLLVDGLPLHSTVSSFYGVEAVPLIGIDSIEIYRGAGAALTAPESIGGAIDIKTREILSRTYDLRGSVSSDGQHSAAALATQPIGDRSGALAGAQIGTIAPVDYDENGVAELPRQDTLSALAKYAWRAEDRSELDLRLSYARLKAFGGTTDRTRVGQATPTLAGPEDFVDRDVRKPFIGAKEKIADNVSLNRYEAAARFRKALGGGASLSFGAGAAFQDQAAIYSHGYDYANKDRLFVGTAQYQRVLGEKHLLAAGVDAKVQAMNSESEALFVKRSPPLPRDDLRYRSAGAYVQDTWFIDENNELSGVLRVDSLKTRWTALGKEINENVVAPRLMYKHVHNPVFTSRLALGVGYRAPLTLFESQHGTDHNGFVLDINRLEIAPSLVYSLAGQWQDDFFEFGAHLTRISNLAYGLDQAGIDAPTIFKNAEEAYLISVFDLSYGRRFTESWTAESILEIFRMPDGYKAKLPVAAVESRFTVKSEQALGRWKATQRLNVVGPRNLAPYGYFRHYNVAYTDQDPLSPTFGETTAAEQKWQRAPLYATLDFTVERTLRPGLTASVSILNALNYTQTRAGDSPTTWHLHGDHFHLDNFHIWGPLRGRQLFLGVTATL